MRILTVPTLNLRPGMNAVAFFTYIVKFPAFLTGLLHALHLYRVGQVCRKMCHKCVTRCVASVSQACKTPFIPHVSPNSVHS